MLRRIHGREASLAEAVCHKDLFGSEPKAVASVVGMLEPGHLYITTKRPAHPRALAGNVCV